MTPRRTATLALSLSLSRSLTTMMPFTMIKKTIDSVATASSTLFSRIGKLGSVRVARPVKVDDVLPTPEPASYVAMFAPLNSRELT
jgi:hypothetical protein